ncbi:hypothetical protein [Caldiplasma sukawensis]
MEGSVTIETDKINQAGPGKPFPGFINAEQRLNRDSTVAFCLNSDIKTYFDGFSASGIRALRIAKETTIKPIAAEINQKAYNILLQNMKYNNVDFETHNDSFESIISKYHFDFIDVDPYGSVIPYIDISLRFVKNHKYVAFTATDLSVLTGSVEKKNRIVYGTKIPDNNFRHEAGVRSLIGNIAKRAISLESGIKVEMAFWHSHYYRVVLSVHRGYENAIKTENLIGYFNPRTIDQFYEDDHYGPLWMGKLENKNLKIKPENVDEKNWEFLSSLQNEDLSLFFIDVERTFSIRGRNLPSMKKIREICHKHNLNLSRTHFSVTGIKSVNLGETNQILLESIK